MYIHKQKTLLKGAAGLDVDQHISMLQTIYKNEFDYIPLKSQLLTSSSSLRLKLQSNMPLTMKRLTRQMQELNPGKKAFLSQVIQLVQYCLVTSALNAVTEQRSSVLRRIKTYLRNTITQNRLNHTVFLEGALMRISKSSYIFELKPKTQIFLHS